MAVTPTAPPPSAEYLAESKVTLLNVFYSIPIALEVISTLFRLWVKARPASTSKLAFDDYLMIWATICAVGVCISGLVYGPPYGLGRHIEAVAPEDVRMLLIGDYIFSHFYDVAIACTKLSVLALYYRIFSTRKFRATVIATSVIVCLWLIAMEVVLGLGCRPIKAWWGDTQEPYTCVNKVHFTYFTNIMNLTLDLWIFSMPIPIILTLQVTKDRRISLLFLFSVGLATCAISAARLTFVFGVGTADFTWRMTGLGILSAWEPCGGILCANLPLVYRAILQIVKSVRDTVQGTRQRDADASKTHAPSQAALSHDWTRLNNSDHLVSSRDDLTPSSLDKSSAALNQYELNSVSVSKGNY